MLITETIKMRLKIKQTEPQRISQFLHNRVYILGSLVIRLTHFPIFSAISEYQGHFISKFNDKKNVKTWWIQYINHVCLPQIKIKMMISKILFFAFGSIIALSGQELNDEKIQELELKLRVNQNITGMSEDHYQMLWNKAMDSLSGTSKAWFLCRTML